MDSKKDDKDPLDDRSRSPAYNETQETGSHSNSNDKTSTSMPIDIKDSDTATKSQKFTTDAAGLMTDSDGNPIPLDKIIKTVNTMSSMMMAHKIALDDDFKLEPGMDISGPLMSLSPIIGSSPSRTGTTGGNQSGEPSLQSKVKDIVHDAYWDLFKSELATQVGENIEEKKFDISKQLLCDVKQRMIELLLPQHSRLKQDIEDRLDPKIIEQLCNVASLDLLDYAKYILDVLSKLCAPVRDEKLKELSETTDIVQLYRGIMELLEFMRLDFANFTINSFKPHIKAHSQEYERAKFNDILKQQQSIGIDGLEYTKVWLKRAVERVDANYGVADIVNNTTSDIDNEELASSSMMSMDSSSNTFTKQDKISKSDIINKVLNTAYSELLEWSDKKQKLYPETLLFDEATFKQLREQYKVLVLTSSILLTTFASVNKFKLHDNNEFKILIKSHVITLLTATYENQPTSSSNNINDNIDQAKLETIATLLIKDIKEKLKTTNETALDSNFESNMSLFHNQILDIQNSSNRIRELCRRRILEFVETLLSIDIEHQQKKISSKHAPPVNIPLGLNCLADEITLTMAQLVKIIRYNRKVFFHHYENIIVDLVSKMI